MSKGLFVLIFMSLLLGCRSDANLPTDTAVSFTPTSIPSTIVPTATAIPPTPTAIAPTATPMPLTQKQEIANLVAFARLYGVVRYFHPSDQVAEIDDWGNIVMSGIDLVRDARTPEQLAERLNNFFAPLAPTLLVTVGEAGEGETAVFQPDTLDNHQLIMWEHYGIEADNTYELYTSQRITSSADDPSDKFHDPQQPYVQPLGGGLYAYVPISLFVKDGETLPTMSTSLDAVYNREFDLQTSYLATGIMFWVIAQHFYPYFDVVDTDWSLALEEMIQRMLMGEDTPAWDTAMRLLIADMQDGHSYFASKTPPYTPYVSLGWIEEQIVIIEAVGQAGNKLQPGDVVLDIEGEDAVALLEEQIRLASGSTLERKRLAALKVLLGGEELTQLTITVARADGSEEDVQLERNMFAGSFVTDNRPANFSELAPGVFYINLAVSNNNERLLTRMTSLENVKGIVFDIRGYPMIEPDFLELIISEPISTAQFLVPETSTPNQEAVTFVDGAWTLQPRGTDPITTNVVFLTDGNAISYSETLLAMVKHHQVGEIVGEATAGTNGNVNTLLTPTGHVLRWTGMKVLNQDGSQHHGIGVTPTVPVLQTLDDLRNGVDTQLQVAIELIETSQE